MRVGVRGGVEGGVSCEWGGVSGEVRVGRCEWRCGGRCEWGGVRVAARLPST